MIALVYMNRGRWVVDCPREECGWAYHAMTPYGEPRYLHRCDGDRNGPGCGAMIELVWPPLDEALEMERALFARRLLVTRNNHVGEGADALLAENDSYFVGWSLARLVEKGVN